ncbi:VOC family protein [Erythrobacter sp. 3-20A1M]|uniref:VOC family protein n=1 Tax=Erythrobacter sp. 3-20A1M TaxID=2653850 RepID=UPI001BFC9BF9|nr:VOC family protein [Erythrobacter sp. 3-20A1M]
MEQTRPAFYKIFVADLDRAAAFYAQCLGFSEQRRVDAGPFEEVILTPAQTGAALVLCRWSDGRALENGNAHGPVGFYVGQLDSTMEQMKGAGATVTFGPVDFSGARMAILTDPDGHQLELIEKGD